MLKILLRVRLAAIRHWMSTQFTSDGQQKKWKLWAFAALAVYLLFAMGALVWLVLSSAAAPLLQADSGWLYFFMAWSAGLGLMVIGSAFFAKSQLFDAVDNDLLMSLPLSDRDILLSRLCLLLIASCVLYLPVLIPAVAVWAMTAGAGAWLPRFLAVFLPLPLPAVAIAVILGWLINAVTSRVRHKTLVSVLLTLLFLVGYGYMSMRLNSLISGLVSGSAALAASVGNAGLLYLVGSSVESGGFIRVAAVLALYAAVCIVIYAYLCRNYIRLATVKRSTAAARVRPLSSRQTGVSRALYLRELRRFCSSAVYLLNTGLGCIIAVAGAAALVIKRDMLPGILTALPGAQALLPYIMVLALCFLFSTVCICAPSVSLEGKNLWIVRTLPVSSHQILRAKLRLQLSIALPSSLIASGLCLIALRPPLTECAVLLVLPALFEVFSALLGLWFGLRYANLTWTNEVQVIKSGMALLFTLLVSLAALAVPLAVFFLTGQHSPVTAAVCFAALLAAGSIWLRQLLKTEGCRLFEAL